jgi:molybdopterin-guanine dinucleotide biosynthesis protein A
MFEGEPSFKWSNFCCSPACGETAMPATKIKGVTGVILAGGGSSRMGSNKSLLLHMGNRIIEVIYRNLADLFEEVIIVTNTPELYPFLPCRKVPDIYSGQGVMAGIHAGLSRSREGAIFVVACDMPHLRGALIRHLATLADGVDVVMPVTVGGFEPLHAIYRKECLPVLEELLQNTENRRVVALLSEVRVRKVIPEEIALFDPEFTSFDNINTPEEYRKLRKSQ